MVDFKAHVCFHAELRKTTGTFQYWSTTASTTGVTITTSYRQSYHVMKNEDNGLKLYLIFVCPLSLYKMAKKVSQHQHLFTLDQA